MTDNNIFDYEINNDGSISITGLNVERRKLTELVIPEKIDGKKVTKIGHHAFCQCTSIESVIIPDSVVTIEHYAFYDCRSLKEIIIPNSVKTIGHHAFSGCRSLERVILPNGIKEIEYSTFNDCAALKEIIIPSGVTRIGSYAFHCCTSLSSVTIPDTVKEINQNAFGYCKSLERVILPDGFLMEDDSFPSECKLIGYNKDNKEDKTMETNNNIFACILNKDDTISIIGLSDGLEKLTNIDIPAEIDGKKVTKIWKFAFCDCPLLESVTIPNTITEIGYGAFRFCKLLKSVAIPNPSAKVDINAFPVECEVIVGKDNDDKNDESVDYGKLISEMDIIKDAVSYAHELVNKSTEIIRAFGKDEELSSLNPKDFDCKVNEYINKYNKAYMNAITALIDVLKIVSQEDRNISNSYTELLDLTTAHVNNMLIMLSDDKRRLDKIWNKMAKINSMASAIDDMLERIES